MILTKSEKTFSFLTIQNLVDSRRRYIELLITTYDTIKCYKNCKI